MAYDEGMKKSGFLFILSVTGLLLACGEGGSSSSLSSIEASSSSIEPAPTYARMNIDGDFTIDFDLMISDALTNFRLDIDGVSLKVKTDNEMERLGDVLDYTYYQVSNLIGELSAESILMTIKRGRATVLYDFETTSINCYLLEGTFYVDLSNLDFTDIDWSSLGVAEEDIPTGKLYFKDALSFLNDEKFRTLADVLSLGIFGMDTLLSFAQNDPVIDSALTMERYDAEQFLVEYALSSDSIAALVGQFSSESASEVKTAIDNALAFVPDSHVSLLYNAKTQGLSNFSLCGGVIPNLEAISEEAAKSIKNFTFTVDATLFTDKAEDFVIPSLDDYKEYQLPQQESQGEE